MITTVETDGGGIAVTVRRDRRSSGWWAVLGPDARRIGTVRPVGVSTADWWAARRDDVVLGRAATFGAALGMVVDAAIDIDTRRRQNADGCTDDDDDAPGGFLLDIDTRRRQHADGCTDDDDAPGGFLLLRREYAALRRAYAAAPLLPRRQRADGRTDDEAPGHLPPPRLVRSPGRRRDHRDGDE